MSIASQPATLVKYGKTLYEEMRRAFDYSQIVWTMQRYDAEMGRERAEQLVEAFLQWISMAPLNTEDTYIVMFKTPVEDAFHAFVLNTRLYRGFCQRFLGFFFHHDPLAEERGPKVDKLARYTVERLESEFGDSLHPELRNWRKQLNEGTFIVACVGPGGHCHK